MRKLLVLRPEPGASATAARARSLGLDPLVSPLFAVEPVAWTAPGPARFDALLLTSANALRHAGPGLAALAGLPAVAVGEATAEAARALGLGVIEVGTGGAEAVLDALPGEQRLLHLCGEQHAPTFGPHSVTRVPVYRSRALEVTLPPLADTVALVHSPRAGARFAELVTERSATAIAAISAAAAAACGAGWQSIDWIEAPGDPALLELAARLCQSRGR